MGGSIAALAGKTGSHRTIRQEHFCRYFCQSLEEQYQGIERSLKARSSLSLLGPTNFSEIQYFI
ncbi:hypothetical protein [uncultured Sphingobium sp.]|uniref:hypothetical protein n=1 Tax=uncultured Sphingobium sp. TaxID=316087 RepID=UPI00259BCC56|nr:hypothetical protein [uncultured Sphingobium sp.]